VRRIAREAGLPTADKKDSQGICFIGKVTLKEFLGEYLPKSEGQVLSTSGEVVGSHDGSYFYTIGQRHGLGIAAEEPYYVANKDIKTNTVTLATRKDEKLYQEEVTITGMNLIGKEDIPSEVDVRIRYRQPLEKAKVKMKNEKVYIEFDVPQKFVAPGQSAVFYDGEGKMLGGGIIT